MSAVKKKSGNEPMPNRRQYEVQSPLHSLMYGNLGKKPTMATNAEKREQKKKAQEEASKPKNRFEEKLATEFQTQINGLNETLARMYDANMRVSIEAYAPDDKHPKKMAMKITGISKELTF